jgi:hypothetical protein
MFWDDKYGTQGLSSDVSKELSLLQVYSLFGSGLH